MLILYEHTQIHTHVHTNIIGLVGNL